MADDIGTEEWAEDFILGIVDRAGFDLEITEIALDDNDYLKIELGGPDAALAIGREGLGLDALQHLVTAAAIHARLPRRRILVDVEGYRDRREQRLRDEALRLADEAIATGREQELAPMSPRERRLVHMALSEVDGVTTESAGEGQDRYVRVVPTEG